MGITPLKKSKIKGENSMGIASLITKSKLDECYGELKHVSNTSKNPKLKRSCLKCSSWTGIGGPGKAFKCYCGDCPAKLRDEAARKIQLKGRNKRKK
jgi:hypothetical protein